MTSSFFQYSLASPHHTRLVTIVAHVDHGKTSLADHLVQHGTGGSVVSERMAGTLRFLDSDPEEQRRGITMRTSSILLSHSFRVPPPLRHKFRQVADDDGDPVTKENLVVPMSFHLADSPGHSDFALEVSRSLWTCDSALVVLDVVEGMGARTHQVLRETLAQKLVPILVLNKLDRLCRDLKLTPTEAYARLRELLETVNAAAAAAVLAAEQEEGGRERGNEGLGRAVDDIPSNDELEKRWTFDPSKGNVVFASALFGMGFSVPGLAKTLFQQKRIKIKPLQLQPFLFGDYKLGPSTDQSKVFKWKSNSSAAEDYPPLFAQFALAPLWEIFEAVSSATDDSNGKLDWNSADLYESLASATSTGSTSPKEGPGGGASLPPSASDWQKLLVQRLSAKTPDALLRAVLRRYRPLSHAVLDAVAAHGPSPADAAKSVRSQLFRLRPPAPPVGAEGEADSIAQPNKPSWQALQQNVSLCDPDAPHVVAQVCKFVAMDPSHVQDPGQPWGGDGSGGPLLLGLTRVLCGTMETGGEYYVLGNDDPDDAVQSLTAVAPVKRKVRLYLLLGSSLVSVPRVPAGHLCAVQNLDNAGFKTATLCSVDYGRPLVAPSQRQQPLVKVQVEPLQASDAADLDIALRQLSLADAAVEVTTSPKGETLLACCGELHLEQSLVDLRKFLGREVPLHISDPIVEFGETTEWMDREVDQFAAFASGAGAPQLPPPVRQASIPPYNEEEGLSFASHGRARSLLAGRVAALRLRVVPLVPAAYRALRECQATTPEGEDAVLQLGRALLCDKGATAQQILDVLLEHCTCDLAANESFMVETPAVRSGLCIRGTSTEYNGELHVPPSVAVDVNASDGREEYIQLRDTIGKLGFQTRSDSHLEERSVTDRAAFDVWLNEMKGSAVAGFQLAVRAGPICEEQLRNVLIVLEGVEVALALQSIPPGSETKVWRPTKPLSGGMVVAALRTGVRCALLTRPCRLIEGILRLTLHSSLPCLGALYSVLSKRRGKVVEDSMVDGTDLLLIEALIPQAEAFGLAPELFGKTSGEVTAPEMIFSHWERLDVDPFWIPTSLEEREDYGELQSAGDASTGMDNTALHYIRKVRQRKGLTVDSSRTIVAAEKQRTLKK